MKVLKLTLDELFALETILEETLGRRDKHLSHGMNAGAFSPLTVAAVTEQISHAVDLKTKVVNAINVK